jgi:hypothetical protein
MESFYKMPARQVVDGSSVAFVSNSLIITSPQARARRRGGASCCGFRRGPIDLIETDLKRCFLEHSRELGPKVVHVLAQFHDCYDLVDLTPHPILAVLLQPLMMVLKKMRIGVFVPQAA